MLGSLTAGITGLKANATAMTVVGDNISNVNTTAFKSNRSSFANILSQSLLGASGGNNIGNGVEFWGTTPSWSQGSIENTTNPTDMAINGKGFFMVEDSTGATFYTRAGEFTFDRFGILRTPDALALQGYEVLSTNPDGSLSLGTISDISAPGDTISQPTASSGFSVSINLDAQAQVNDIYNSSITVYDSLGNSVPVALQFEKVAPTVAPTPPDTALTEWDVTASIPASAGSGAAVSVGQVRFNQDGNLVYPATNPSLNLTLTNGAASPQSIAWNLYDASGTNIGDLTGFSAPSNTTFANQDGYPFGSLRTVSIDEDGVVWGSFTNGQQDPMYVVSLADFTSYYGLTKMGNNLYASSRQSGQALPGTPGSGGLGFVSPSAVEMSNVDLAAEFVKMITTQRAFQANSRVITTSDEVLTELINMKR